MYYTSILGILHPEINKWMSGEDFSKPLPVKLKFDLHTHSRFSADGISEPEEMVEQARRKGLDGFAITDHNTCACIDYFKQMGVMNDEGIPVDGLLIIPGQEISTAAGHLLALGVHLPDLKGIPVDEAVGLIHQQNGVAIPAHPYDVFRAGIREKYLDKLPIDAIEVFNAANTFKHTNDQAFAYAKEKGLPMTAGSDAHHPEAMGVSHTILDCEDFSVNSVLKAIKGSPELECHYLRAKDSFVKTFHNFFRFSFIKKAAQRAHRQSKDA